MARFQDRQKALQLRLEGKSYSQIKDLLKVSKSTLSYWLRNYPLSKQRIRELRDWNERRIEKYRETRRFKREARLKEIYQKQKKSILPLSKRDLFIAGLYLYWGEGSKTRVAEIGIANTDPAIIKFFIYWVTNYLRVPKNKLKVLLHLYKDMNINNEMNFWSRILKIRRSQFKNPYIKKNSSTNINHKGAFGHGTCNIRIGDAKISKEVLMGLRVLQEYFGS